jgi:hypothetical protein
VASHRAERVGVSVVRAELTRARHAQVLKGDFQGRRGVVKFVGPVRFASGNWVGVDLGAPVGKNDGSVQGVRYFSAPHAHGIFIKAAMLQIVEDRVSAKRGACACACARAVLRSPPASPQALRSCAAKVRSDATLRFSSSPAHSPRPRRRRRRRGSARGAGAAANCAAVANARRARATAKPVVPAAALRALQPRLALAVHQPAALRPPRLGLGGGRGWRDAAGARRARRPRRRRPSTVALDECAAVGARPRAAVAARARPPQDDEFQTRFAARHPIIAAPVSPAPRSAPRGRQAEAVHWQDAAQDGARGGVGVLTIARGR